MEKKIYKLTSCGNSKLIELSEEEANGVRKIMDAFVEWEYDNTWVEEVTNKEIIEEVYKVENSIHHTEEILDALKSRRISLMDSLSEYEQKRITKALLKSTNLNKNI